MSHDIRDATIAGLGELHYGRKRIQPASRDLRRFHEKASSVSKHSLLTIDGLASDAIAAAFDEVIRPRTYTCYACAIMPDHVHLLIRKHRDSADVMIECLQEATRTALVDAGLRSAEHPVWGGSGWKVFLSTADEMRRVARYIEDNR